MIAFSLWSDSLFTLELWREGDSLRKAGGTVSIHVRRGGFGAGREWLRGRRRALCFGWIRWPKSRYWASIRTSASAWRSTRWGPCFSRVIELNAPTTSSHNCCFPRAQGCTSGPLRWARILSWLWTAPDSLWLRSPQAGFRWPSPRSDQGDGSWKLAATGNSFGRWLGCECTWWIARRSRCWICRRGIFQRKALRLCCGWARWWLVRTCWAWRWSGWTWPTGKYVVS